MIHQLIHVGADILNLLFLYKFFIFLHVSQILIFDKVIYLYFFLKSIFSVRLTNSL